MQKKKESLLNLPSQIDIFKTQDIFFNKIKIVDIQEKDLDFLQNLELLIFENPWHLFDFSFFYSLCFMRAVKMSNQIIGYSIFRYEKNSNKKNICHLLKIGVHPEFQNIGIGSALLKDMFLNMKKRRIKIVYLEVREGNKNAISFYENKGFFKSKVIENYYENGESAFIMIKKS